MMKMIKIKMRLSDFDYALPRELIAQRPCEPRDHARLMVLDRRAGTITHRRFFELPALLRPTDVLVFNESRVVPARLDFTYRGRTCELFFVRDIHADASTDGRTLVWEALLRPGRYFPVGTVFDLSPSCSVTILAAPSHDTHDDVHGTRDAHSTHDASDSSVYRVSVRDRAGRDTWSLLDEMGRVPLPPYITTDEGASAYQTVYARDPGSVAAPTAGFHFTESLLDALRARGVRDTYVTLHVGPGTFMPVRVDAIEKHRMHAEYFTLPLTTANQLTMAKQAGSRIIAVGSTATRVLESCARTNSSPAFSHLTPQSGETNIFIYPGYEWRFIDGLITNFHLPKSTLLMLVSSFAGYDLTMRAYAEAVKENYRFFSFGDGMLIL